MEVDRAGRSEWTVVDGSRVHSRVYGEGGAPGGDVVLVHGLGVSGRYLAPLARELAGGFRVLVPDLPGFGQSEKPARALDVGELAEVLLRWSEVRGLESPAVLGNSLGCQIVVEAMARRPGAFSRAVLVGPTFDRAARRLGPQVVRLLRSGVFERPSLTLVIARDYRACGARRAFETARHGLAHRVEDRLSQIAVPMLVVRGSHDAVAPQRWAREVAEGLPDARLAVVPGGGHTLNYSRPAALADVVRPFLGGAPPGPDAATARAGEKSIAGFDSATAMVRGAAAWLHGEDLPAIGAVPRMLAPTVERLVPALDRLPAGARERIYQAGSGSEAVSPDLLHTVSVEAVARWIVDRYPRRRCPVAVVGSSSGALVHLAAALGAPFLPQTFLLPVAERDVDPDDPAAGMRAGLGSGRLLLDANPEVALHHMHDPNQDRLSLDRMTYFRLKRRTLGQAMTDFLVEVLPRGGSLLVSDCTLTWPVTRVGERHVFQFGALGGMPAEEFHTGSDRVAAYLARYGSDRRRWHPPPVDARAPEAEWGFDDALLPDLLKLADQHGWEVRRLGFEHPEALSPVVVDLYRWWYQDRGMSADDLLVESFVLLDPALAIRSGSVPYWSTFAVEPSANALERYLDEAASYDRIRLALFNHGTEGVGLAPAERWRGILDRARVHGEWLGVDPDLFPRDLGSFVRFGRELRQLPRRPAPSRLTLAEAASFLAARGFELSPVGRG